MGLLDKDNIHVGLTINIKGVTMRFLLIFLLIIIIPLWAQNKVKRTFKRYMKTKNSSGLTGAEAARYLLDLNELESVSVKRSKGITGDHYDPKKLVIRLSPKNYDNNSLTSVVVAAHEVGHALQDKQEYVLFKFRQAFYPVASIGSNLAFYLLIFGLLFGFTHLAIYGLVFMATIVLFQLATLPVELNASNRAMNQLLSAGVITARESGGARQILNAAALTYVAAVLVALLQFVYFFLAIFGWRR